MSINFGKYIGYTFFTLMNIHKNYHKYFFNAFAIHSYTDLLFSVPHLSTISITQYVNIAHRYEACFYRNNYS